MRSVYSRIRLCRGVDDRHSDALWTRAVCVRRLWKLCAVCSWVLQLCSCQPNVYLVRGGVLLQYWVDVADAERVSHRAVLTVRRKCVHTVSDGSIRRGDGFGQRRVQRSV